MAHRDHRRDVAEAAPADRVGNLRDLTENLVTGEAFSAFLFRTLLLVAPGVQLNLQVVDLGFESIDSLDDRINLRDGIRIGLSLAIAQPMQEESERGYLERILATDLTFKASEPLAGRIPTTGVGPLVGTRLNHLRSPDGWSRRARRWSGCALFVG